MNNDIHSKRKKILNSFRRIKQLPFNSFRAFFPYLKLLISKTNPTCRCSIYTNREIHNATRTHGQNTQHFHSFFHMCTQAHSPIGSQAHTDMHATATNTLARIQAHRHCRGNRVCILRPTDTFSIRTAIVVERAFIVLLLYTIVYTIVYNQPAFKSYKKVAHTGVYKCGTLAQVHTHTNNGR